VALSTKKGSFAAATATGNQAVVGVGFVPKAILFWGTRLTAAGYGVGLRMFFGAATSATDRWVSAIAGDDAAATMNTGRQISTNACIRNLIDGTPTTDALADFVSFDADGFTINWSDAPPSAWIIHYLALGGDSITNAVAGNSSLADSTGAQAFTGVGFLPEFLMFCSNGRSGTGASSSANFHLGAASSSARQGAASFRDRDAQTTSQTALYQRVNKCIAAVATSSDVVNNEATLTSFDADGFTLDVTTSVSAITVGYLALKGGNYFVGGETQRTSTGTKATTGLGFKPSGLLAWGTNRAASTAVSSTLNKLSIGGSDGVAEGHIWVESVDNAADADLDQRTETTKAIGFATNPSTTDAEADVSTFDADGFTLDWTTADGTAREFVYAAFGPADTAPPGTTDPRRRALMGVGV